ncbi:ultraviolet-B receptor UVR8 isoform X3 [Nematostella vectensis]|uniref:ultraviolet-B receptor UVR8 isoform X3 n=1 Tax=Nematostella vectensis TaxID=45351 RepID=UPI00207767C4|nr:ultraviolet-B receptor UVR8 isoform X3 [Nematostella vectensis]
METVTPVQALNEMIKGEFMLKAGRVGRPHFRRFKLSKDLSSLEWDSPRKGKEKSVVPISMMIQLIIGQKTKVFESCQVPQYECLSFSIMYKVNNGPIRSLDIVCKSRREFDIWTCGIQALLSGFSDIQAMNKVDFEDSQDQTDSGTVEVEFGLLGQATVHVKEDACDIYTWGEGTNGMLGHGEDTQEAHPHVVEALLGKDIRKVACGATHTLALSKDGEVFSWGSGYGGRLGQGHLRDRFTPIRICGLESLNLTQVACNEFHSAAVCDNGELYTWGKSGPRLGYKCHSKQTSPRIVPDLENVRITGVACGLKHTLACSKQGALFSFGENDYGQLGIPEDKLLTSYIQCVSSLSEHKISRVACGRFHSAALAEHGSLWLWGCNESGQLGNGNYTSTSLPSLLEAGNDLRHDAVMEVACGDQHSAFITKKGRMFCCGDNTYGQLGVHLNDNQDDHVTYNVAVRVRVPTDFRCVHVACGDSHTAVVTDGGEIFTWGRGKGGRLGHGDNLNRHLPTEIEIGMEGKHVRGVSCGRAHTACTVTRAWVPDQEVKTCMACKTRFTTVRRRHHCRKCGGVFCGACSSKRVPILSLGYSAPVRVCDKCNAILTQDS